MITHMLTAVGSGSLVGFTLGLVVGGGSILATPALCRRHRPASYRDWNRCARGLSTYWPG